MKFDSNTMKIVLDGVNHAIVELTEHGGPNFGVLVKKTGKIWRSVLYYGWSETSFVQSRFDKLEGALTECPWCHRK